MTSGERMLCECSDHGCPNCGGSDECMEPKVAILYRRDMFDDQGTAFCEGCGEDALESGLFD